jgi:hypothetical protein
VRAILETRDETNKYYKFDTFVFMKITFSRDKTNCNKLNGITTKILMMKILNEIKQIS